MKIRTENTIASMIPVLIAELFELSDTGVGAPVSVLFLPIIVELAPGELVVVVDTGAVLKQFEAYEGSSKQEDKHLKMVPAQPQDLQNETVPL
ncbi:hypothetical protein HDV04_006180 [Boothiomyces sp. JEL0838]|nr:hypothetical protein HDV04_006180 [Boothiomyces sp. JEL0838]